MPMQKTGEWSAITRIFALLRRVGIRPAYFIVPVLLSLGSAMCEGLSLSLLIPLLQGFLQKDFSFTQSIPGLSVVIASVGSFVRINDRSLFLIVIFLFVGAILLKNLLRYLSMVGMSFVGMRGLHHLRKALFTRYLQFGKQYFDKTNVGHHSTVILQTADGSLRPVFTIDKYINAFFSIIAYLVTMLFISWKLTLFALPFFFILHRSVGFVIRRISSLSKTILERRSALSKKTVEILSAIPLVQSFNTEESEKKLFTVISDEKAKLDQRDASLQAFLLPFQETITLISVIVLFCVMLYLLVNGSGPSASAFIVYFYLMMNASSKFGTLTGLRGNLASSIGAIDQVENLFSDEGKYLISEGKKEFTELRKGITFQHLQFAYGDREVLSDISFTIEKGQMTAIVGPTGAGKTTLISLLLRFYDCPPGSIFIDGTDIREFRIASLRKHMALVSQETFMLHESLRHNIVYGSGEVSDARVEEVVRQARLEDFVASLPEGLETLVGDRGMKLSGGEKQRISLARALLRGADILILDEATSALDSTTERLIQEALMDAVQGKTAIVIAHRLSTIREAQKIVVVQEGSIAEEGTLEQLLKKEKAFYRFWQEQQFIADA